MAMAGALLSAGLDNPRFGLVLIGAGMLGLDCTLVAVAPIYWLFAGALVVIGVAALILTNTTNSMVQLSTEPAMRRRVMTLRAGVVGVIVARRAAKYDIEILRVRMNSTNCHRRYNPMKKQAIENTSERSVFKTERITKDWNEVGTFQAQINLCGFWGEHKG